MMTQQSSGTVEGTSLKSRLLVICVDRDNDVGEKTGITTPVIGRDACIGAAQRLALEDPEDADSNSIFSAIKTYEDLISKGYEAQVVVVTGNKNRGIQADEKIVLEIKSTLQSFNANGAVIVSDGEDDESVIPIIQGIIPVVSVKRVVMKVSRSVEYSYAVFGKYLKTIIYDSKYSKFFLGVPGILLLIGGIGAVSGYTEEIFSFLVIILGAAFLIRAFDIDRAWSSLTRPTPVGFIRIFTLITGILLILSSIPAGFGAVAIDVLRPELEILEVFMDKVRLGQFIAGAMPILWVGIGTIFGGTFLGNWISGVPRRISDTLRLVVLAALYPTVAQFTNILIYDQSSLTLIPALLGGLAATLVTAAVLFKKYHKRGHEEISQ